MPRLAALCLALAIAPVALPGAGTATARALAIGITQYPSTLHPAFDSMVAKSYVNGMALRPFTVYGPDWKLMCMLCTELPTFENGKAVKETTAEGNPGVALTYTIRSGAAWGDGTPLTSQDVRFAWEVGRHPQTGVANQELYRRITAVDIVDDRTFTLHVDELTYDYNAINDLYPLPAHLEQAVFDADPARYQNRSNYVAEPTLAGLWYGPYRVASVVPGSAIGLEPNPTWYGEAPDFERVTVKVVENTAALEANLLAGDIDMIAGELGFTLDQALAFEKRNGDRFQIVYKPGLSYEHIDMNLDNPILRDLRVRRALLHAIDREAISQRLFEGRQPAAATFVNPLDWVYDPDVPTYPHDPSVAAALLDEAGWRLGPDGIRRNADGEPLRLEIVTTAGNRTRELIEQVIQGMLRAIGVDLEIRNQPARVMFAETLTKRRFTALALYAWISAPEHVPRTTLHSDEIPREANAWSGQNYPGFANAEMDALIDAVELELDRPKRKALWARIQAIYATELPVLPLFFRAQAFILPKWLTGVVPTGHLAPTTLWIEEWQGSE